MFTSDQACALADITYRQLVYWCDLDVIEPIGGANPGSGRARRFDIDELFVLSIVGDLVRLGISLDAAKRVAVWIRLVGVATRGQVFIDADGWILNDPPTACFVVDLDQLRASLDERAAVLSSA